jgi:hypothetical protein
MFSIQTWDKNIEVIVISPITRYLEERVTELSDIGSVTQKVLVRPTTFYCHAY